MSLYTFTFQKLEKTIVDSRTNGNKMKIGFIQRHTTNRNEMLSHPRDLCNDCVLIDSRHIFFDYRDNNEAILCIEDYGKLDVCEECVDLLTRVNDEFDDDIIDDENSSWRILIFDNNSDSIYELNILSIDILTNEEEAIVQCKYCRRYC